LEGRAGVASGGTCSVTSAARPKASVVHILADVSVQAAQSINSVQSDIFTQPVDFARHAADTPYIGVLYTS